MWEYSTRPVDGVLTRDPVAGGTAGASWRAKREYVDTVPLWESAGRRADQYTILGMCEAMRSESHLGQV